MYVTKVEEHIHLVDVEAADIRDFIASYILRGKKVAIVETGPTSSIPNLLSALRELNVKPEDVAYVAVSHIHLDHGGGVGSLLRHLPEAQVIVHPRGAPHLAEPEKLWQQSREVLGTIAEIYGKPEPVPQERIIAARDGMTFDIGEGVSLKVVETLGHASHHVSYYEPRSEGIFPGDAAGVYIKANDVVVPTTPAPFRLDIALASLDKLNGLKPKALYYTHFGKAHDAPSRLQAYAETLKLWARVASQGIEDKDDLDRIRERIIQSDSALRKVIGYIQGHLVLRETVLTESVQGFVDFVTKFR